MYYETKFRQRFYWLVVETWGYKSNIFLFYAIFLASLPSASLSRISYSIIVFIVFFVSRPHRFRHPTSVTCYVISLRVFSPAVRHKLPYRARLVFLFFFLSYFYCPFVPVGLPRSDFSSNGIFRMHRLRPRRTHRVHQQTPQRISALS